MVTAKMKVMSQLVKLRDGQMLWSNAQFIFPTGLASQGDLNKDVMMA